MTSPAVQIRGKRRNDEKSLLTKFGFSRPHRKLFSSSIHSFPFAFSFSRSCCTALQCRISSAYTPTRNYARPLRIGSIRRRIVSRRSRVKREDWMCCSRRTKNWTSTISVRSFLPFYFFDRRVSTSFLTRFRRFRRAVDWEERRHSFHASIVDHSAQYPHQRWRIPTPSTHSPEIPLPRHFSRQRAHSSRRRNARSAIRPRRRISSKTIQSFLQLFLSLLSSH